MSGSGLIADDIRANALQLYLSRPITRTQYIAGKAAILMAALAAVTFAAGDAAAPARARVRRQHDVPAARTCRSSRRSRRTRVIQITLSAFLILALSSLSKSRWFVAILYAGLAFFTHAVFGVLGAARRQRPRFRGCRSLRTSARSATSCSACRRGTTRIRSCPRRSSRSSSPPRRSCCAAAFAPSRWSHDR